MDLSTVITMISTGLTAVSLVQNFLQGKTKNNQTYAALLKLEIVQNIILLKDTYENYPSAENKADFFKDSVSQLTITELKSIFYEGLEGKVFLKAYRKARKTDNKIKRIELFDSITNGIANTERIKKDAENQDYLNNINKKQPLKRIKTLQNHFEKIQSFLDAPVITLV